jgi:hypothetical protein
MLDLLQAIGASRDLIQDWEVTRQPGGVLLRFRSRESHDTTGAATAAGQALVDWVVESGYEFLAEPIVRARPDDGRAGGWQGWAEVVLRREPTRQLRSEPAG